MPQPFRLVSDSVQMFSLYCPISRSISWHLFLSCKCKKRLIKHFYRYHLSSVKSIKNHTLGTPCREHFGIFCTNLDSCFFCFHEDTFRNVIVIGFPHSIYFFPSLFRRKTKNRQNFYEYLLNIFVATKETTNFNENFKSHYPVIRT